MNGNENQTMSIVPAIVEEIKTELANDYQNAKQWVQQYLLYCMAWGAGSFCLSAGIGWGVAIVFPQFAYLELFACLSFLLFAICVYRAHVLNMGRLNQLRTVTPQERTNLMVAIIATGLLSICTVLASLGLLTYKLSPIVEASLREQIKAPLVDSGAVEIEPKAPAKNANAHLASIKSSAPVKELSKEDQLRQAYFERFWKVAVVEKQKYNIPASITLAQGAIESCNGTSPLFKKHNASFGIKTWCKHTNKNANGHCSQIETVHSGDEATDRYRNYQNAWESYRHHSEWLLSVQGGKYAQLAKQDAGYKEWAKNLELWGYAEDKTYSEKLIAIIERWQLYKYDDL